MALLLFPTISVIVLSLASLSNAQIIVQRRRSSTGRIIAAVVISVVSLLVLMMLFYALARRRRIRSGAVRGPLFSVPWNRGNNPPPPYPPGQGPPYGFPQQNHNTEYPPQNGWAPPAYKPEQTFAPPPGPPPGQTNMYSPPPGPPPPAHTAS